MAIARWCPLIDAKPRAIKTGAVALRRVRVAGIAPTLTSLSLTVADTIPIL
jgi:hypothetical protein